MTKQEIAKAWGNMSLTDKLRWLSAAELIPDYHEYIFLTGFDLFCAINLFDGIKKKEVKNAKL